MVVNIKYLIVTIAAVFFSLGIGIMIGFNLNNSEIFTQQQIKLVDDMDKKLNELRTKNDELTTLLTDKDNTIQIHKDFIEQYYKILIKDKLIGKNIFIIQTTEDYFFSEIEQMPAITGANIAIYMHLNPANFNNIISLDYPELFTENQLDKDKLFSYIVTLVNAKNQEQLDILQQKGIIKIISQSNIDLPINHALILGGDMNDNNTKVQEIDLKLVNALASFDIVTTFAEESTANYSSVEAFKILNVSTIDNIDQNIGKVSLVSVISGLKGNYGIKESADRIFPNQSE